MRPSSLTRLLAFVLFAALFNSWALQDAYAQTLTPGFTYQGRVSRNGAPLNGVCDLNFKVYDAPVGGVQIGASLTTTSINVANGLFSLMINSKNEFGAQAFTGQRRWLAVAVRYPAGSGAFVSLSPRQELSATPYALGLIGGATIRNDATNGVGLAVESLNGNGPGLLATSAGGAGVEGVSNGVAAGVGVYGHSVNQPGVIGESVNQIGVSGISKNMTGVNGASTNGAGVYGSSTYSFGVQGKAANAGSYGVRGENSGGGGGVYGTANSGPGASVAGVVGHNDGTGYGVVGNSKSGYGVMGINSSANGPGMGGVLGNSTNNYGVIGSSVNLVGVYGNSTNDSGIQGSSAKSYAIYGSTLNANGKSAIFGDHLTTGSGVMGHGSTNGNGVVGVSGAGSGYSSYAYTKGIGVWGDSATGPGVMATSTGSYPGLYAQSTGAPAIKIGGSGAFNLIDGGKFYFNWLGYLTCAKVTVQPMDLAELIPVAQGKPQAGDVVEIDPDNANNFRLAATANSTRVAGVISTAPGLTLGSTDSPEDQKKPQLALAGRVPVKVCSEGGPIQPGDLLAAASTPGHAMRAPSNPAPGTIIGKALEPLASGSGVINMLVMLR